MMCLSQGIQAGILGCQNWLHLQYVTVKWKIKRELQLFNLVPVQEMGIGGRKGLLWDRGRPGSLCTLLGPGQGTGGAASRGCLSCPHAGEVEICTLKHLLGKKRLFEDEYPSSSGSARACGIPMEHLKRL